MARFIEEGKEEETQEVITDIAAEPTQAESAEPVQQEQVEDEGLPDKYKGKSAKRI